MENQQQNQEAVAASEYLIRLAKDVLIAAEAVKNMERQLQKMKQAAIDDLNKKVVAASTPDKK